MIFHRINSLCPAFVAFCVLFTFFATGCGKPQPHQNSATTYEKLYLKSQRELAAGNYKQAYDDYQRAVKADASAANINHLSSILYSWAIAESEPADAPLLRAQKRVWLEPRQLALRRKLLKLAIDSGKGYIRAFGLAIIKKSRNSAQTDLLAEEAALADAKAWVARLATWVADGVECPFDVSGTVIGVETLKATAIDGTIYVVEVSAPIDCLR